jgi:ribosomal protein L29
MHEFENKSGNDLVKELAEKREALRKFRFGVAGSNIKNVKEALGIRKTIARILTALRMREIKAHAVAKK